eukprot:m.256796 g.256796  ORF g.256796 m.256796 type:complete len:109 (+) comp26578_c0_seq12:3508-3834(+)
MQHFTGADQLTKICCPNWQTQEHRSIQPAAAVLACVMVRFVEEMNLSRNHDLTQRREDRDCEHRESWDCTRWTRHQIRILARPQTPPLYLVCQLATQFGKSKNQNRIH